jgi:DNA-directed RNA polymerase subunit RPC12/RpoP
MADPLNKSSANGKSELRVICSQCGSYLIAESKDAGRKATCPECGGAFVICPPDIATPRPETPKTPSRNGGAFRLKDEQAASEARARAPSVPVGEEKGSAPGRVELLTIENHRTRSQLAGWLRRVVIVALALAVVKVFEAAFASAPASVQTTLHVTLLWIAKATRAVPESLQLLTVEREVVLGALTPLERFVLALGLLLFATRLMVRAKLIDAVYVTTPRWNERTAAGLVVNFLALMLLAGLLAWTASVAKLPMASDGLACGLIAMILLVSGLWLATLHLMAGNEYPELTKWMVTDAAFGLAILLVVLWPGLTFLWSRAGATGVLFLANSAAALHVGASFIFTRRPRRWWWHKPVSIVVSAVLLLTAAALMACVR